MHIRCSLTGYSGRGTAATVTIAAFDRAARVRRAPKGLAPSWMAAGPLDVLGTWRFPRPVAYRACQRALTLSRPPEPAVAG